MFLSFVSCNLHIVNNAFGKGFEKLSEYSEIDLDHFAIDLHFFFKFSSARREDYEKRSDITDDCAKYMLKHSTICWLSIERVVVRIIEQYEILKNIVWKHYLNKKIFKKHIQGIKGLLRI